jgi:hypothetical protein
VNRPSGVTASAIVCLIGSALTLLFGAMLLVAASSPEAQSDAQFVEMRAAVFATIALMCGAAALGIATGVGLLRMRAWARMSALVFGGMLTFICGLGVLLVSFIPFDAMLTGPSAISAGALRMILVTTYAVPLLIGVWWLVMFNSRSVKAAFADGGSASTPARPVAISLIGWFNIVGGVFVLITAMTGMPAIAVGQVLTGWAATLFYVFTGAVNTYLGWHLLKLDPHARILTIWWFVITILHTAYMAFMPGAIQRLRQFQQIYLAEQGDAPPPFDTTSFTIIVMVVTMIILAAAIWPLVRYRSAFESAASDQAGLP